jgi:ABC-type Mn2+/Zn2+ transport system ATPase subunit
MESRNEPPLVARGLVVGHAGRPLLPPLDLAVHTGELWGVIGPNGGGKTTLLRTLLGLLPPVAGGVSRPRAGTSVGYVPQRGELDPAVPMRALDAVLSGTDRGWSFLRPGFSRAQRAAATQALVDVGLAHLARARLSELSEGQRQRVLLARALAGAPSVLLLDEPTSAMDLAAERAVFEQLVGLRRQRGVALVVVSHHLSLLGEHATHLAVLDQDEGLALLGPRAEVMARPEFLERYGKLDHAPRGGAR